MLTQEQLHYLKVLKDQGCKAGEMITKHEALLNKKDHLEDILKNCTSCRSITIEHAFRQNYTFEVCDETRSLQYIKKAILTELDIVSQKLLAMSIEFSLVGSF